MKVYSSTQIVLLSVGAFALAIITGCASTVIETRDLQSYYIGVIETHPVGQPFVVDQSGTSETVRRWVGLFNSPDGWAEVTTFSMDFVRRELIYSGKSGSTIEISYREFRGGLAAPAFYQGLRYDLASSNIIRFQNFKIQVHEAGNDYIKIEILED